MEELKLPPTFEELRKEFEASQINQKMMEFVKPIEEAEKSILQIRSEIKNSGRLVFLLAAPGVGKSTFIQSLSWRKHLGFRKLEEIDAEEYLGEEKLKKITQKIIEISKQAESEKDIGATLVAINYLESLADFPDAQVRGFFRDINGVLRKYPILIVWPVTEKIDVEDMLKKANAVSGTIFSRGREYIEFLGPSKESFPDIAKNTISVVNGKDLEFFGLTHYDLEENLLELSRNTASKITIRNYYFSIMKSWKENSNHLNKLTSVMPKPNEIWFIFSYPEAESIVGLFTRKGARHEEAWSAVSDKLYEYVESSPQRKAIWTPQNLQLMLTGAVKTRIMYLPTNCAISLIKSFSQNNQLLATLENSPKAWSEPYRALKQFKNSPMVRQLQGELSPAGKRKSGPAAKSLEKAKPDFDRVVDWIVGPGGNDTHINNAIAEGLKKLGYMCATGQEHPWIPGIRPDILVELEDKQICIEFHYTKNNAQSKIADYVLDKLFTYKKQLDLYSAQPKQLSLY